MGTSISQELSVRTFRPTYNKIMIRLILLILFGLCPLPMWSSTALSQDDTNTSLMSNEQLDELVRRAIVFLDSGQLQQRQQAEQALIDQGPRVLDLLPTDLEPYSSEVRNRLNRIRQELYTQVAVQTSHGSRFSLSGIYRFSDVIRELKLQTGNEVTTRRDVGDTIELELKNAPFHQALDNILDLANLDIEPYFAPHPNQILIKPRLEGIQNRENNGQYVGPFRITATNINTSRDLRKPMRANCAITLRLSWEPRVRPLYLSMSTSSLRAVDDTNHELTPLVDGEKTLNVEGTAPLVEVEIPFSMPAKGAEKLSAVRGSIFAMVPGRKEHFEFSNLETSSSFPKQQRRAGVTITVNSVRQTEGQTIVELTLHYKDAGNAFESHRGWTTRNRVYLTSHDKPLPEKARRETIDQKKESVTYRFAFETKADLEKLAFHYHTPALLMERQVEFELHDLPLP